MFSIIQKYALLKGIIAISSKFIKPKLEKWHINNKVDDCLINYDLVLYKYFERSARKCSLLNTVVQDIEKKTTKRHLFTINTRIYVFFSK